MDSVFHAFRNTLCVWRRTKGLYAGAPESTRENKVMDKKLPIAEFRSAGQGRFSNRPIIPVSDCDNENLFLDLK